MKDLIKKILDWIANIPHDKLLHDYAGELIAMFAFALLFRFNVGLWWCFAISNVIAVLVLILKEIYDAHHKEQHSVEIKDILWGVKGMALFDIAALIMFL